MEEKNEIEIMDDVMLPGFRFHPTDEELVGFYLKRKIQQKSIPIEIIKQVDIYKYDPWDLPKMAISGEKEMYFFCQRDRKYRNSARPNRVTKGGFWKATGTDRPIYSSHHGKCIIGLKKSLVFYRGRAAKGTKTEWMMHEFRLPSSLPLHSSLPSNKTTTTLPPSESWAICRIFKKPNSTSNMVQKALYKPWITHLQESMVVDDMLNHHAGGVATSNCNHFSPLNNLSSKCPQIPISIRDNIGESTESSIFSTMEGSSSMLFNGVCVGFEGTNQQFGGFSVSVPQDMLQANVSRGIGFPFSLLDDTNDEDNAWKSTMQWDSPLMF